jgi:hypothetical protein
VRHEENQFLMSQNLIFVNGRMATDLFVRVSKGTVIQFAFNLEKRF